MAADWFDGRDNPAGGLLRWFARQTEKYGYTPGPYYDGDKKNHLSAWWFFKSPTSNSSYQPANILPAILGSYDEDIAISLIEDGCGILSFPTLSAAWRWALDTWRRAYHEGKLKDLYPYKLEQVNV